MLARVLGLWALVRFRSLDNITLYTTFFSTSFFGKLEPFRRRDVLRSIRCYFSALALTSEVWKGIVWISIQLSVFVFVFSRVSSGISHFLSFFPVLKHFGKGFDGCGKLCLWLK